MRIVFLFLAAFLACAVEMVEALTIVLAVGVTRGWRSTLIGAGAAGLALAAVVAALGPALTVIPIDTLRLVAVGLLLTTFGIFWGAEGAGASWPGSDAALPVILGFLVIVSVGLVRVLRRRHARMRAAVAGAGS